MQNVSRWIMIGMHDRDHAAAVALVAKSRVWKASCPKSHARAASCPLLAGHLLCPEASSAIDVQGLNNSCGLDLLPSAPCFLVTEHTRLTFHRSSSLLSVSLHFITLIALPPVQVILDELDRKLWYSWVHTHTQSSPRLTIRTQLPFSDFRSAPVRHFHPLRRRRNRRDHSGFFLAKCRPFSATSSLDPVSATSIFTFRASKPPYLLASSRFIAQKHIWSSSPSIRTCRDEPDVPRVKA
ncbi:hypothetical protein PHBOTO_000090 [Pseudozyma hubeiensis]|nr:hypothetical protein PHBOTO_000090 [Pseudozyma hubeiensis]